jgi:hypothetical protein
LTAARLSVEREIKLCYLSALGRTRSGSLHKASPAPCISEFLSSLHFISRDQLQHTYKPAKMAFAVMQRGALNVQAKFSKKGAKGCVQLINSKRRQLVAARNVSGRFWTWRTGHFWQGTPCSCLVCLSPLLPQHNQGCPQEGCQGCLIRHLLVSSSLPRAPACEVQFKTEIFQQTCQHSQINKQYAYQISIYVLFLSAGMALSAQSGWVPSPPTPPAT